jgi:hypothetical protein
MVDPCPDRTLIVIIFLGLFHLLHTEAPFSIHAFKLIAISACFAKAVKVSFSQLLLVNDGGDRLSKAGIAEG